MIPLNDFPRITSECYPLHQKGPLSDPPVSSNQWPCVPYRMKDVIVPSKTDIVLVPCWHSPTRNPLREWNTINKSKIRDTIAGPEVFGGRPRIQPGPLDLLETTTWIRRLCFSVSFWLRKIKYFGLLISQTCLNLHA